MLRDNVEQVLTGVSINETKAIEHRLREIDEARNDYITLIASGSTDESALDEQFQKLYAEEQKLNQRLEHLKSQNKVDTYERNRLDRTIREIDDNNCELLEYNDILIRKLIECVRVVSKTEIQIIFKGGIETTAIVEK